MLFDFRRKAKARPLTSFLASVWATKTHDLESNRHSVKQSAKGIDGLDKLVGFDIENEQIPIGYAGMFYDISDMPNRQNIVIAIECSWALKVTSLPSILYPPESMGLIIRLERNDIKPVITIP